MNVRWIRHNRSKGAALVATVAVLLTACSSSSNSGGTTTPSDSGSGSSSSPTGTPIKIGAAVGKTGQSASIFGVTEDAMKAWQNYTNSHGGIGGHPVEVIVRDTKSTPADGLAAAKQLVESDKVVAMLQLDAVSEAGNKAYLATTNVPLLGYLLSAAATIPAGQYPLGASLTSFLPGQLAAAASLGAKVAGGLYCAEAPVCAQTAAIYKPAADKLGIKFVGGLPVSATAPNYTAACLQLMNQNVDFIQIDIAQAVGKRVIADCLKQGYKGAFGITGGAFTVSAFKDLKGAKIVGTLTAFPWMVDAPGAKTYRDSMTRYAPDVDYRNQSSTTVWSALALFAKLVGSSTVTTDVTSTAITAAYQGVKNESLDGLLAQTLTSGQPWPVVKCYWEFSYTGGDDDAKLEKATGTSGNGQTGDLATTCTN